VASKIRQAIFKDNLGRSTQKTSGDNLSNQESQQFYEQIETITKKNLIAFRNYTMEPFDDKVYLFKAKIPTYYVDDTEFLGWKQYAKQGIELYEVPGDHLSMIESPNVEEFAPLLQKSINQCFF
jgi:thioesterase domain-containing protein